MMGLRIRPDVVVVGSTVSRWDHFWAVYFWCRDVKIWPWHAAALAWNCLQTRREEE